MASKSELPPDVVTAIVQSSERLEGAISILTVLEENVFDTRPGVKASELAAIRSIIEASVKQLDEVWKDIQVYPLVFARRRAMGACSGKLRYNVGEK